MKSPYVICGATGHVGSRIAEKLLAGGDGIPLEKFMLTPAAEWVA